MCESESGGPADTQRADDRTSDNDARTLVGKPTGVDLAKQDIERAPTSHTCRVALCPQKDIIKGVVIGTTFKILYNCPAGWQHVVSFVLSHVP